MRQASDPFAPLRKARPARQNSLLWIIEPLERDPNFTHRKMFGCDAAYLDGSLYLVVAERDEPWNGVLVCTSHDRQEALIDEVPALVPHPQLSKWLYLPQSDEQFEAWATHLVELALARDPRMGVVPKPRARRRKSWRSDE